MLAKFNLDSLYVNLLKRRSDELEWKKLIAIKYIILHIVISLITLIVLAIARNFYGFLAMTLINFFSILLDYRLLRKMLSLAKTEEVDEILYGKSYASIYVNEEKLANLLGSMNNSLGIFSIMPQYIIHIILIQIVFFCLLM